MLKCDYKKQSKSPTSNKKNDFSHSNKKGIFACIQAKIQFTEECR